MSYCDFRGHRISYTTEFLKQMQLSIKLQNSTTEICATHIEELQVFCMYFTRVLGMKVGGGT